MSAPTISVVLPTFRQPEVLIQTLRDLRHQTYPDDAWELVIIDDGSDDGSAIVGLNAFPDDLPVTMKRLPPRSENYGHAELFNELIRLSRPKTDLIVQVEDVRLRDDFLKHHAKWYKTEETTLVTGPICEAPRETFEPEACERWELMEMSGTRTKAYECGFRSVWAKTMSYSTQLVDRLSQTEHENPYDRNMSDWGLHEVEFAYRAVNHADAICVYDVDCAVYHPPHSPRDEQIHRGIHREKEMATGEKQNTEYVLDKHGMDELPSWVVGNPIDRPEANLIR